MCVGAIFKDVTPFWVAEIFRILPIALVPGIALLLPSWMWHCDALVEDLGKTSSRFAFW